MPPKQLVISYVLYYSCFKIILISLDLRHSTLWCILKYPFYRENHHSVTERGKCHVNVSLPSHLFLFVVFLLAGGRDLGLTEARVKLKMTWTSISHLKNTRNLWGSKKKDFFGPKCRPHIREFIQTQNCATTPQSKRLMRNQKVSFFLLKICVFSNSLWSFHGKYLMPYTVLHHQVFCMSWGWNCHSGYSWVIPWMRTAHFWIRNFQKGEMHEQKYIFSLWCYYYFAELDFCTSRTQEAVSTFLDTSPSG